MTAPKLITTGVVLCVGGGRINIDGPAPVPGEESLGIPASADAERAYAELLLKDGAIRITVEPTADRYRAPTIEQIKDRLRAALPNYRRFGFEPSARNVVADIADEVAKMIEEARS